jgi:carboxyl-terminal processing protease
MPKRNLAWILVITIITLLMWQLPQIIAGRDAVIQAFGPLVDARAQIRRRFVEETDDSALTRAAVDAGIRAMVQVLDDPHATYLNADEYERFKSRTDGVFVGIGVDIWAAETGLEVLSRDPPDSPAAAAGILPGDIITHIDGRPTRDTSLVDAVNNQLSGPPHTIVRLTLVRPGDGPGAPPRHVEVERTVIHSNPVRGWSRYPTGGWRFMLDPEFHIGYIRLTKFTADVAGRLDQEVDRLLRAGLRGLVLDLRDNTGGLLDSAREVADRFLEGGLIVRVSGRRTDQKEWSAMRDGTYPDFALAILVNDATASAAEIVAGALRDHRRAAVVGERTYGKGSVQEVVELDRRSGAIKLTTAFYYLPGGQCIHRTPAALRDKSWGVAPTIHVPLAPRQRSQRSAAWRNLGREIVGDPSTRSAATRPGEAAEETERRQAAADLLAADIQLARAVEHLRALQRPATRPAPGAKESPPGTQTAPAAPPAPPSAGG